MVGTIILCIFLLCLISSGVSIYMISTFPYPSPQKNNILVFYEEENDILQEEKNVLISQEEENYILDEEENGILNEDENYVLDEEEL